MIDILHKSEVTGEGFRCPECGVDLPVEVASLGDDVVELGGAGVHWLPAFAFDGKPRSCASTATRGTALIVCPSCAGDGCEGCGNQGVISSSGSTVEVKAAVPKGREVVERAPRKSKFEKRVSRQASQNFWAMREQTKPCS